MRYVSILFGVVLLMGMVSCSETAQNSAANAFDNAGSAVRSLGGPPFFYNDGQPVQQEEEEESQHKK